MEKIKFNINFEGVQDVSQLAKFINPRAILNYRIKWWVIPIVSFMFLIVSCGLLILPIKYNVWKTVLAFVSILIGGYNTALVHIKWENKIATCIIGVCLVGVFLVSIGIIPLDSIAKEVWEVAKERIL